VEEGMWIVKSSTYVIHDKWIKVRSEHCVTPAGYSIEPYYTIEYPDFVHVLAFTDDGSVVLTRQYRHGFKDYVLELPGGMKDENESCPAATGVRELREETGYRVARHEVLPAHSTDPAKLTNRTHLVLGFGAFDAGEREMDPAEKIEVVVMPVADLVALIGEGRFKNLSHVGMVFLGLSRIGYFSR
jgi:8-oxo-dGTP pyrophosphatase MutT (NUDIX family)